MPAAAGVAGAAAHALKADGGHAGCSGYGVMTRGVFLALTLFLTGSARAEPFALPRVYARAEAGSGDLFGGAVLPMANLFVVGAPYDDTAAADGGAVHILDLASGGVVRTITAPAAQAGERFGSALTLVGASLVVGAPHADSGAPHAGEVHFFDLATGAHQRVVPDPTPAFDDLFGAALAPCADGGLAIGAPFDGTGGNAAGTVFILDAASGGLRMILPNPDGEAYALFGNALAATGRLLVVGAPLASTAVNRGGAVYLLDLDDGSTRATLVSPRPRPGDRFGDALAATSQGVLVGAPFDDTAGSHAGAAFLFDTAGNLVRTFTAPDAALDDRLGSSVALGDDLVLVGAPFADAGTQRDVGRAYLFRASDGALLATFESPVPFEGEQFGGTVAFEGHNVVVGAPHDSLPVPNAGSVSYFVDLGQPTTTSTSTSTSTSTTTDSTSPDGSTTTTSTAGDPGSTTTSTGNLPPPTTTTTATTLPLACGPALPCNDEDACTVDTCVDAFCRFDPLVDHDAVLCRLTTIASLLGPPPSAGRAARRLRAKLDRQLARARALVELSRHRHGAGMRRALVRAGSRLAAFTGTVQLGSTRGIVPPLIAQDVLVLANEAGVRLALLRAAVGGA